jgi:PKD repeat protein
MARQSEVVRRGGLSHDTYAARRKGGRVGQRAGAAPASGFERLEERMMMSAVRPDAAFIGTDLGVGDDRSYPTTGSAGYSLGFNTPINFFGSLYSGVFVNNNGHVSLGARNSFYFNYGLESLTAKMIAPFYANVDTRFTAGNTARYGRGTVDGRAAFGVTWTNIGYYPNTATQAPRNSFQLVLVDRSDVASGAFDIEFNYDKIQWESGTSAGGGSDGLGGSGARAGWTFGTNSPGTLFQMAGSGVAGSFLDTNMAQGLVHNSFMSGVDGRYVYRFRAGTWIDDPSTGAVNNVPVLNLPADQVLVEAADGTTRLNLGASFADPDADLWNVTVDYGDGSGPVPVAWNAGKGFNLDHTYLREGNYTVTVTVDDGKGGVATGTVGVAIQDLTAPLVLGVVMVPTVHENESTELSLLLGSDPDSNRYTYRWEGSGTAAGAKFHFLAPDNGTYTVRLTVTDPSGNASSVDVPVVVHNVNPTASGFWGATLLNEGGTLSVALSGADDASPVDLLAGLTYSFDLDGDGVFEITGGSSSTASHVFNDNGLHLVRARVTDKDGGYSEYEKWVTVLNVAPVASGLSHSGNVDEGGTVSFSLNGVSDPSSADITAGLTYDFDLDGDGVFELSSASANASRLYSNSGTYLVRARVTDKDGGSTEYQSVVTVRNVAPVSSGLSGPSSANEGQALSFSLGLATDPSAADTAAGFTYSFDFDGDGVFEFSGPSATQNHLFDDNGVYTVRARVTDQDGGYTEYSAVVTVHNVAPCMGFFTDNNPVAEGSLVTLSFGGMVDPSGADTVAGFTYSYDFNNDGVFDLVTKSASATYRYDDNGTYTVRGRVTDKDGGYTDYLNEVEVYNVAPTADLSAVGAVIEGSMVTIGLNGATDPSGADLAAGLTYSFDLNNDGVYEITGTAATVTRTWAQDGSYIVKARVSDKDGAHTDYTATIVVDNAAPVVSGFTSSAASFGRVSQGESVWVSGSFTDAGKLDRHTAVIDWGDGTTSKVSVYGSNGRGGFFGTHVYKQGGMYTMSLKVTDDASLPGVGNATAGAIISGVGLHDGVLHIIGTNDKDKVSISKDGRDGLKVKTDLTRRDTVFSSASVREIRAVLGGGRDSFEVDSKVTQTVYLNGVRYTSGSGPSRRDRYDGNYDSATSSLFSDRLVA